MSCNCVKDLEARMTEKLRDKPEYRKPVKKVELGPEVLAIVGNQLLARQASVLSIKLEGQKKVEEVKVVHRFCAFCGTELDALR